MSSGASSPLDSGPSEIQPRRLEWSTPLKFIVRLPIPRYHLIFWPPRDVLEKVREAKIGHGVVDRTSSRDPTKELHQASYGVIDYSQNRDQILDS